MPEYCGKKFSKTKYNPITEPTKTVVTFAEENSTFKVHASRSGINFEGTMSEDVFGEDRLEDLAQLVADAWKEHRMLKVNLQASKTGH